MARKGRKGRKRGGRRFKRAAPRRDRATPLGASGGLLMTGIEIASHKQSGYTYPSMIDALKAGKYVYAVQYSLPAALKTPDNYKYGLAGVLVSASPKLPLIGLVAKPVDKALRKATKGKVSL